MSLIAPALRPLRRVLRSSLSHPPLLAAARSPAHRIPAAGRAPSVAHHAPIGAAGIHSSAFSRSAAPTPASTKGATPATPTAAAAADDGDVDSILGIKLSAQAFPPAVLAALDVRNATRSQQRNARKRGIIERFRRSPSDTGSPEVQIAILTDRIKDLTTHMLANKKDTGKKRTMSILVNQRRRLMAYLLRKSPERYSTLVAELGLRPNAVFSKDVPLGAKKAPGPVLR